MTTELVRKFIELQKAPIEKKTRFVYLVARFKDFPWAQDTIMAAYQLEEGRGASKLSVAPPRSRARDPTSIEGGR